jgi:aspartyl aminopeptidase
VEEGTSPFHVVQSAAAQLQEAGFEELELGREWNLNNGGKYYIIHHGSCLVAFTVGEHFTYRDSLRLTAAHTDFPGLRIKVKPEVLKEGYGQLNVEVYGGAILNTWLDRPLSVSGRVALRSEEPFYPEIRLVDFKKPLMVIPNLAIHFDRDMNKGVELNRQKDMLPLATFPVT